MWYDTYKRREGGKMKKKQKSLGQLVMMLFMLAVGGGCGYFGASVVGSAVNLNGEEAARKWVLLLTGVLLIFYVSIFVQIVVHEAGHLVFGLLTGYRFCSFRIGSFMLVRKEGKLRCRRFSLAGTGGQCLMVPPEEQEGKIPYVLYNMGGILFNFLLAVLSVLAYVLTRRAHPFLGAAFLVNAIIGAALGLMNGIPMGNGSVDNDGSNALHLGENPQALHSFWLQMKINAMITEEKRLKDMPKEWFAIPGDEALKNSMCASAAVLAFSRKMDEMDFKGAEALGRELLEKNTGMAGVHRYLVISELIFCELVGENRREVIEGYYDKSFRKFARAMKSYPSVIRMEYAKALLYDRDESLAEKCKAKFEKTAKSYPHACEIEGERELLAYAENRRISA